MRVFLFFIEKGGLFMNGLRDLIATVNGKVNDFVWGLPMLVLLVGTGILMTVLTKGFQLIYFKYWMDNTVGAIFKNKHVTAHTARRTVPSASFRAFVRLWRRPSVPAISPVLPRPLRQAAPGQFSGCGLWRFSV